MNESNFNAFKKSLKQPLGIFGYFRIKKLIRKWRKRVKNNRYRLEVLREWVKTEKNYITDLKLIQDEIRKPLMTAKNPLITTEQEGYIFANIDVIIRLSTDLYDGLEKLMKEWNPRKTLIGPPLLALCAYFKLYTVYCNSFYKGQAALKQIKDKQ